MHFKLKMYLFLYVLLFVFLGCSPGKEYKEDDRKIENVIKSVSKISENSIEFMINTTEDDIKKTYTLIKDENVIESNIAFEEKILILNELEQGDYTILFKIFSKNNIYRTLPYEFNIDKLDKKAVIKDVEMIKKNDNANLKIYIKNKENQEIYLKELTVNLFNVEGENVNSKFQTLSNFVPTLLKENEEKIVEMEYKILDNSINTVFIEINIDGYTENERKMVKLISDKRYSKFVKAEDIKINLINSYDNLMENEKTEIAFNIKGMKKGKINVYYGNYIKEYSFSENEILLFDFIAEKNIKNIYFKIEELNYNVVKNINIVEKRNIQLGVKDTAKINERVEVKILNGDNLNKDDFFIKCDTNFILENIDENNIYIFKPKNSGIFNISLYYKNEFICERTIKIVEEENIKLDEIKIVENMGKISIKGVIKVKNQNIFRLKDIKSEGININKINDCDYEVLSKIKGEVNINIEGSLIENSDFIITLCFEELETFKIHKIEIKNR